MSLIKKLWDKGELPAITTEITIPNETLIRTAVAVLIVTFIIMLAAKLLTRL
jgi:hypothetical protein